MEAPVITRKWKTDCHPCSLRKGRHLPPSPTLLKLLCVPAFNVLSYTRRPSTLCRGHLYLETPTILQLHHLSLLKQTLIAVMEDSLKVWIIGAIAALVNITTLVFNVIFAIEIPTSLFAAVHVLLYVAFGFGLAATAGIVFFSSLYVRYLRNRSLGLKATTWSLFASGVTISTLSQAISGVVLFWLIVRRDDLPQKLLDQNSISMVGVWIGLWGLSVLSQITLFLLLGLWTKQTLKSQSVQRLDLDFGIRISQIDQIRPSTRTSHRSFQSQDITLVSPPRTPSRAGSTTRRSSSTRNGPGSSKTKLIRSSAKSSLDIAPFPANEAVSIDNAFDQWDTSSVHREMRAMIHSSPPVTRSGLETIPGSRPESPANALDGPFLPSSPQASCSDAGTTANWNSSSPTQYQLSSPPTSPPNFSRPTSSSQNKPPSRGFDNSMHDLIHPLFRPNSPRPPPIAIAGTMVTASPMADQLITPRTLARIRSNSQPGHWRAMPSIDKTERPSTAGSVKSNAGPGSPGPSIIEEPDLPPILPGFVLSAGSRTSLVGYGKRKSVKEKRKSQQSIGSRLSTLLF